MTKLTLLSLLLLSLLPSLGHAALSERDRAEIGIQNLLQNAGFESSTGEWIKSGGTLSAEAYGGDQKGTYAKFVATAADQYFESKPAVVPETLKGQSAQALCQIKNPSIGAKIAAYDEDDLLLAEQTIPASDGFRTRSVNFIFPESKKVKVRVTASAAGEIHADDCYVGPAKNLMQVSQSRLVGTLTYLAASGCRWSVGSSSWADFPANASCTAPGVTGDAIAPTTRIPSVSFDYLPPGDYRVEVTGGFYALTDNTLVYFAIFDGTSRRDTGVVFRGAGGTGSDRTGVLVAPFRYTEGKSNASFRVQAIRQAGSGTAAIINDVMLGEHSLRISVYYYPLQSEIAHRADAGGLDAGDIVTTASTSCPMGTIAADGASYATTLYPRLFARIGYAHGGSGANFSVPTVSAEPGLKACVRTIEATPAPVMVGGVTTSGTGLVTEVGGFEGPTPISSCTSSPCKLINVEGDWLESVTRNKTGEYTINIKPGVFSKPPICLFTPGLGIVPHESGPVTPTQYTFQLRSLANSVEIDRYIRQFACIGVR